jgi:hypothetical protein
MWIATAERTIKRLSEEAQQQHAPSSALVGIGPHMKDCIWGGIYCQPVARGKPQPECNLLYVSKKKIQRIPLYPKQVHINY